jgi:hypothetical protein
MAAAILAIADPLTRSMIAGFLKRREGATPMSPATEVSAPHEGG